MRKGRTAPWGLGLLFIHLFLCIQILSASVKNNTLPQTGMNMFPGSAAPAVRLFMSASVDQLQTDVATFDQTLNTYITNGKKLDSDIQVVLKGLDLINTMATSLKNLDDGLTTVEKLIKYAQALPQVEVQEKANQLEKKMQSIHPPVTKACTTVNNFNDKITPTRQKLQSFDDKLQKLIAAAEKFEKGLNTYTKDIARAQQCINSLPDGSTKDGLQARLDQLANASDKRVVEANKILTDIIKVVDAIDKKINTEIKKLLEPIDDLEADIAALLKDLTEIINPLKDLESLFSKSFCVPFPDPSIRHPLRTHSVCIGFDIILQGEEKIKNEIERILGKTLYKVAKAFGIDKLVNKLKDLGDKALDPILKELHLDIKVNLPGLGSLEQNLKDLSTELGDLSNMMTLDTQPLQDAFDKIEKDIQDMENIYQNCKP
ncbi:MAG: hypothetical protein EHM64_04540 [Ignavibacteriae bacterium]|nr:MAG: hypothetical protein EHM64_04540 [Ignavibacteriota bacterium]